jgi:hypothetical protein
MLVRLHRFQSAMLQRATPPVGGAVFVAIFIMLCLGVDPAIAGPLFENEKQLRALVAESEADVSALGKSVAEPHRNADRLRAAALEALVRRVHLMCVVLSYQHFLYESGSVETRIELAPMWNRATKEANGLEVLLRRILNADKAELVELVGDLHLKNQSHERMVKELLTPPHNNRRTESNQHIHDNAVIEKGEQLTRKMIALLLHSSFEE